MGEMIVNVCRMDLTLLTYSYSAIVLGDGHERNMVLGPVVLFLGADSGDVTNEFTVVVRTILRIPLRPLEIKCIVK